MYLFGGGWAGCRQEGSLAEACNGLINLCTQTGHQGEAESCTLFTWLINIYSLGGKHELI